VEDEINAVAQVRGEVRERESGGGEGRGGAEEGRGRGGQGSQSSVSGRRRGSRPLRRAPRPRPPPERRPNPSVYWFPCNPIPFPGSRQGPGPGSGQDHQARVAQGRQHAHALPAHHPKGGEGGAEPPAGQVRGGPERGGSGPLAARCAWSTPQLRQEGAVWGDGPSPPSPAAVSPRTHASPSGLRPRAALFPQKSAPPPVPLKSALPPFPANPKPPPSPPKTHRYKLLETRKDGTKFTNAALRDAAERLGAAAGKYEDLQKDLVAQVGGVNWGRGGLAGGPLVPGLAGLLGDAGNGSAG
jgi:hypothetical protein